MPQVLIGIEGGARELLDGVRGDLHTVDWEGAGGSYFSGRLVCVEPRRLRRRASDAYLYMRRIGLTLDDVTAPTLQLGGTLLEPGSRRGDQVLDVNTADTGSGVRSVTVEVNGQPLDTRTLDCQVKDDVAIRLRPCPGAPTPSFDIATTGAQFRQGPNELTRLLVGLLARGDRQHDLRDAHGPHRQRLPDLARPRLRPASPLQGRG